MYGKEIQTIINPQYWLIPESTNQSARQPLALSELTEKIERVTKQKIKFIQPGENLKDSWQVRLTNKNYLNINPYNGNILLNYNLTDTFYGFVMYWHRWLLYENKANERPMQLWVSIASLILIIELIVGFTLWAKPKHRLKRLKVRWKAKNKIRFMQLHATIGVIFCIPLILIAFSGVSFFWQDETKKIVEWLSFSKIQKHSYQYKQLSNQEDIQLDKAYDVASSALMEGNIYRIYLPYDMNTPLALRVKMPEESHANSWSLADPYSGELLNVFDASRTSIATKIWNFKYKFHIGDFIGWPIKTLWLLISLIPCFFVLSGIYLWIKREYQ
jgi:uncharacterized iron-regulated membrane protein